MGPMALEAASLKDSLKSVVNQPMFQRLPQTAKDAFESFLSHAGPYCLIKDTNTSVMSSSAPCPSTSEVAPVEMELEAQSQSSASTRSNKRSVSQRSPSMSSGTDLDSDDSGSPNSGFTVVKGKRKRRARNRALVPDTPASPSPPASPKSRADKPAPPIFPKKADRTPLTQTTNMTGSQPPILKCRAPPPVFLRDKSRWSEISNLCTAQKVNYTRAENTGVAIKIEVPSIEDFRSLTRLLSVNKAPYHTYALPEERKVRVVLRGIPTELPTEDVANDLTKQGYTVEAVHHMYSRVGKSFPLVLVIMPNTDKSRELFSHSELTVCGLSRVTVERPHRRGTPGQCHRCQLYGHAAANCSASPRCVKCLVPHLTKECTRTRDSPSPPACVLCGLTGHTANYKGCPRAPRVARLKSGKPKTSVPSHFFGARKAQGPPPVTTGSFPTLPKSKKAPQVPVPTPAWGPVKQTKAGTPSAPSAAAPPKQASAPNATGKNGNSIADDIHLIFNSIKGINLNEISVLAGKLRRAKTSQEKLIALCEHNSLLSAFDAQS